MDVNEGRHFSEPAVSPASWKRWTMLRSAA